MHCIKCGTSIPEGSLYCPKCGNAVQMVQDYTSLESILADEVGDVLDERTAPVRSNAQRRPADPYERSYRAYDEKDRYDSQYEDRYRSGRLYEDRDRSGRMYEDRDRSGRLYEDRDRSGRMYEDRDRSDRLYEDRDRSGRLYEDRDRSGRLYEDRDRSPRSYDERRGYDNRIRGYQDHRPGGNRNNEYGASRREQAEKKKKKLMILIIAIAAVIVLLVVILISSLGKGSFSSQMKKAEKELNSGDYDTALTEYYEACTMDPESAEPYMGMALAYLGTGDTDSAIAAYKTGISVDAKYSDAYIALAELYLSLDDADAVTNMFVSVSDKTVLKDCSDYIAAVPVISPKGGEYSDTVTVSINADEGTIRYTMDGSMPDANSPQYVEPIVLNDNQNYSIRAVTINSKGIASKDACEEFRMNIPSPDGPSVNPSSGTYNQPTQIVVTVPDDSTVYYTLDGSTPSEKSTVYTGPVDMSEGQSTFSCIAINKNGKESSIIKRQYNLLVLN